MKDCPPLNLDNSGMGYSRFIQPSFSWYLSYNKEKRAIIKIIDFLKKKVEEDPNNAEFRNFYTNFLEFLNDEKEASL